MKKLMILPLLFFSVAIYAQDYLKISSNGLLYVEEIIEYPGHSQNDLYKKAYQGIATFYKQPDEVISAAIEPNMIKGKGSGEVVFSTGLTGSSGTFTYIFQVDFKDGKIKIDFHEFDVYTSAGTFPAEMYAVKKGEFRSSNQAEKMINAINMTINGFIANVDSYVNPQASTDDDW